MHDDLPEKHIPCFEAAFPPVVSVVFTQNGEPDLKVRLSRPQVEAVVGILETFLETEGTHEEILQSLFDRAGVRYFLAKEFLTFGSDHHNPKSKGYGLNELPPLEMLPEIVKVARVWDEVRARVGHPIRTTSVYRSPAYNKAIGGVTSSQHLQGRAADCKCSKTSPAEVAKVALQLRQEGFFKGGVGLYGTFVHIDVRGTNHYWKG